MYVCAIVTCRACNVGGKWTHLISKEPDTLWMQTAWTAIHQSLALIQCAEADTNWCQKEKQHWLSGIILATRRMILTKHVFSATTRGNTTYLFDHLRKYHTAESCTGPILQTCTRPYPPYLKLHTFSNSSTSYILHPSLHAIYWYLWPTRTWRKIRWTQVLKMKVNQHGEWEFWQVRAGMNELIWNINAYHFAGIFL